MHSFRGWGWCGWNRRAKATCREEGDPWRGPTQFPLLCVQSNRIPLSLSALGKLELRFLLLQVSCPFFLLLNAIKHNVLRLCKHFKLLHIWFWMFDRFILNINGFYEITVWKCFFANHCVGCEQNLNPGLKYTNHSFNFALGCLKSLWEIKNKPTNISAYGAPRG